MLIHHELGYGMPEITLEQKTIDEARAAIIKTLFKLLPREVHTVEGFRHVLHECDSMLDKLKLSN